MSNLTKDRLLRLLLLVLLISSTYLLFVSPIIGLFCLFTNIINSMMYLTTLD